MDLTLLYCYTFFASWVLKLAKEVYGSSCLMGDTMALPLLAACLVDPEDEPSYENMVSTFIMSDELNCVSSLSLFLLWCGGPTLVPVACISGLDSKCFLDAPFESRVVPGCIVRLT